DRVDHHALEEQPEHEQRGGEAHQQREREGQAAELHRRQHEKRRQHDELALREVDGLRGLPEQHEADRDERVDAARRDARDRQLQQVRQGYLPRLATYIPCYLPSFGRICTTFCLPSTTSTRKLTRSMSPFASQVVSIRMPGSCLGVMVRPCISLASALRSNLP